VLETADVGATRGSEETLASGEARGDVGIVGTPAGVAGEEASAQGVPLPGYHVGRYIVLGEVGSGAMGVRETP
jgi:hypothetical protein